MRGAPGFRLLRRHLRGHRRELWVLVAWSTVEAVPTFGSGLLVARAIDQGFLAGRLAHGLGWLALLGGLWLISAVATRQLYPWLSRTIEPLRDSLVRAVVTASLHRALAVEHGGTGASVSQATEQVEAVRELLSTLLRNMRQVATSGVAALTGLVVLSPRIAVVVAGFVTLAMIGFVLLQRLLLTRYRRVVLGGEHVGDRAAPVVTGIRDVVAHAAEARAARDAGEAINSQAAAYRAFARARVLRLPVVTVGVHLPLLALLALSPWLLSRNLLSPGELAGGVMYLAGSLQQAVQFLVNAGSTLLVSLGVLLDRLAEVCSAPAPPGNRGGRRPNDHRVRMAGVTFSYSPYAAPIVRELSLEIPEGQHLAVVGPSGVGKSTVANLLTGLVTARQGEIRIGEVPLREIDERWLRQTIALIPQHAYVFAGTVRENLCYLRPEADDEALTTAVAAIGAQATVAKLGDYDAWIGPGGQSLSPAESQLIALARVFLSRAKIVLLDEATCHLDPVAEAQAETAFAGRGGTLIVIAHRISSARRADRVLVMDGVATALGCHHELLASNPLYAELVEHWQGTSATTG